MAASSSFSDLVGIPFRRRGRDPKIGLDCWGLFRLAMERFDNKMPDFDVDPMSIVEISEIGAKERTSGRWEKIEKPEPGCAVAMSLHPDMPEVIQHVGVCVDKRRFIHTLVKTGSIVSRVNDHLGGPKIRGFYRWVR